MPCISVHCRLLSPPVQQAAGICAAGGKYVKPPAPVVVSDKSPNLTSCPVLTLLCLPPRLQVPLKGVVSTVVISTVVLEGWSTKLDPDIRIMESLKEVLPSSWGQRISKTVDRVMSSAPLALTV